jgi:hypothetical protein
VRVTWTIERGVGTIRIVHVDRRRWRPNSTAEHFARWQQLKELGYSPDDVRGLDTRGHLHRLYRGVFAVGHSRLTVRGRWMAAGLACGPTAVLSHRAAITLHELRPIANGPIDVSVPGRTRRGQHGINVHNVRRLHPETERSSMGSPSPPFTAHRWTTRTFESDRVRDTKLQLDGCTTLRLTQQRIEHQRDELRHDLTRALNLAQRDAT